jgi:hypothetical protein
MDPTLLEQVQDQEAMTDDPEAAENARIEARLLDVHTCMPGAIVSYDATKKTATVKPAIQRLYRSKGYVDLPTLVDCPVCFPSGGGFTLTFPLVAGDECVLYFSERAIDLWWQNGIGLGDGQAQPPAEYRTHDLSDAFVQVGVSSVPNVPGNISTTAVELRSTTNASKVSIDGSGNVLVNATGAVTVAASDSTSITGRQILLNAPPGATPQLNGVITGACPCPMGGTHAVYGAAAGLSQTVLVGP